MELMLSNREQLLAGRDIDREDGSQTSVSIISAYNPSPEGEEEGAVLSMLQIILFTNTQSTIIMGDFNLHHSM